MLKHGSVTAFCIFMGFLSALGRNVPGRDILSTEELREYSRDGSAIKEFDIISPQFISNGVFKRSTESVDSFHPSSIQEVQYDAFGGSYSLHLDRNDWLIRSGLQVEILKADGTLEKKPLGSRDCHYFGRISDQEKSAVAISLCNGMHGMVSHNDTDFIIQPLKDHHVERVQSRSRRSLDDPRRRDVDHPHIIYKRTTEATRPPDQDEAPPQEQHHSFCSYEAPVGYHPTAMPFLRSRVGPSGLSQPLPYVGQKYLELFVVADKDMVEFHGNDTEDYVFALMNVVSRRYADPSLDITMRVHIVKFMLLETDNPRLRTSAFEVTGSSETLDDFCAWQSNINPIQDAHPEHWDNAILLTRKNIFTSLTNGRDDSLLGKAYLSSTCRRGLQCSYNQDDGLGSSLVIAHETGHTLGLNHDDDYGCVSGVNIMSSWRPAGPASFTWSECSRQNIRTFLGGPVATCLNDVPSDGPLPVDELSGATYDLDQQCALALGPGAEACQRYIINCGYLRCRNASGCFSLGVGIMDGTSCSRGKWCLTGSCVVKEPLPETIDGGWSDWGQEYGECSRTCGGGVRMRRRYCTNPRPKYGGNNCEGPAEQYQACNLQPCETNQDEYRDQQCAETNEIHFNSHNYTWRSFTTGQSGDDLCTKKCLSSSNFWATRPPYQYVDGTRCWHGDAVDSNSLKLCVSGKCQAFGCDGVQGSSAVYDACRECNGDGSSCEQITGGYDGGRYRKHTQFLEIPVGATSIQITNANLAYTHMAVSTSSDTLFQGYLFTPPSAGRYGAGNAIIKYMPDFTSFRETIYVEGPLSVPLTIQVYLLYDPNAIYGVNVKPKITYRYYVPIERSVYEWMAGQYGECSVTCGGGVQTRRLRCARIHNNRPKEVDDSRCDEIIRPPTTTPCDAGPCPAPAEWARGHWSECDAGCGQGLQTREVKCQRGEVLAPGECSGERPRDSQECNAGACQSNSGWVYGEWSECDVDCGTGVQRRSVECRRGNLPTPGECDASADLTLERPCDAGTCPEWVAEDWDECNVPCGFGIKYRPNRCERDGVVVHKSECDPESKPRSKSPCQQSPCLVPAKWITGPWSRCNVQCGAGNETRFVGCLQGKHEVDDGLCDPAARPGGHRRCTLRPCTTEDQPLDWDAGPWSECSVTCGEGIQLRQITCQLMGNPATKRNCDRSTRPDRVQSCNLAPCVAPAEWVAEDWSECSETCGEGTRVRSVQCRRGNETAPGDCDADDTPSSEETCSMRDCPLPAMWTASSWEECSATCGDGHQTRGVRCQRGREHVDDDECDQSDVPDTQRDCNVAACPTLPPATWVTGEWSECDASCGHGTQERTVTCERDGEEADGACAPDDEPDTERSCDADPCVIGEDVNPDEVCNQLLEVPAGSYTQSHPTGADGCTTTLVAPFGKSFSLRINSLIDCTQGEYLKILEGTRERNLCGQKTDYVLNYRDNVISIIVKTVSSESGYAVSFERRDGRPADRCDRLFLAPSGTIKSPAYPRRYPSNADCRYRIVTAPGTQIRVSFSRFMMQGTYPTCRYDKLEILDPFGLKGYTYCGTRNQFSIVSTGNDMLLRLRTDSRTNLSGFRATYSIR